jgi:AcrR family transcriptional regulator
MSSSSRDSTARLLQAALTLFARHGFQRTSLADVAAEAGVARATLYLHFRDKQALFESLAESLVTGSLAAAAEAWQDDATLAENLTATILAKDLPLWRLHHAPHGAELLAMDADLTRRQVERLDREFAALLAHRIGSTPRVNLEVFEGPEGFGRFLGLAASGLKHETPVEADYCAAVHRLCAVVSRAAGNATAT